MQISMRDEARVIIPSQLIGAAAASEILKLDRSTLSRRIKSGRIVPLAQLDGPSGAYVFDLAEIQALAQIQAVAA